MLAGTVFPQAADLQVGTWKLNVAQSKYNQGPAPKSATTTITTVGAAAKAVVDQVQANGPSATGSSRQL